VILPTNYSSKWQDCVVDLRVFKIDPAGIQTLPYFKMTCVLIYLSLENPVTVSQGNTHHVLDYCIGHGFTGFIHQAANGNIDNF